MKMVQKHYILNYKRCIHLCYGKYTIVNIIGVSNLCYLLKTLKIYG